MPISCAICVWERRWDLQFSTIQFPVAFINPFILLKPFSRSVRPIGIELDNTTGFRRPKLLEKVKLPRQTRPNLNLKIKTWAVTYKANLNSYSEKYTISHYAASLIKGRKNICPSRTLQHFIVRDGNTTPVSNLFSISRFQNLMFQLLFTKSLNRNKIHTEE